MIAFLNSYLAWALLAVTLPLLIHLFTRRKLKVVPFSSLQFLKQMQKEKVRRIRLRQILLLVLRTLALLFIVAAFLRPTLPAGSGVLPGARAGSAIVVVLDNSIRMGTLDQGSSRFSDAAAQIEEIASLLDPADSFWLISAATPARLLRSDPVHTAGEARQLLELVRLGASARDFETAFALAAEQLGNASQLNRELFVFSDEETGLLQTLDAQAFPENTRFFATRDYPEAGENLALTELEIGSQIFEPRKPVDVLVRVANRGSAGGTGRTVYLVLNGRRVAQQKVDVPPGQERTVPFKIVPERTGYQFVQAEIESDALNLDNRRYAFFSIPRELSVLVAGPTEESRRFVRLALDQLRGDSMFRTSDTDTDKLASRNFSNADCVVLCNVPEVGPALAERLRQFVSRGGGLLVFLGPDVDLRDYNEHVFKKFQLGSLGETLGNVAANETILRLGEINFDHPLFAGVFRGEEEKRQVASPAFRFAVRAQPAQGTEVVMRYSNQAPFLLQRRFENGIVLAFLTSAAADWSDFAYKGIFAPLINRSVQLAATRGNIPGHALLAGTPATASILAERGASFHVQGPNGNATRIRPEIRGDRYVFSYDATEIQGFYELRADSTVAYVWASNFEPDATLPAKTAGESVTAKADVRWLTPGSALAAQITASRYGRELWQPLLILALALLAIEMLLFRSRAESLAPETGTASPGSTQERSASGAAFTANRS